MSVSRPGFSPEPQIGTHPMATSTSPRGWLISCSNRTRPNQSLISRLKSSSPVVSFSANGTIIHPSVRAQIRESHWPFSFPPTAHARQQQLRKALSVASAPTLAPVQSFLLRHLQLPPRLRKQPLNTFPFIYSCSGKSIPLTVSRGIF